MPAGEIYHTCIATLVRAAEGTGHVSSNSIHMPASHAEQATGCGRIPAAHDTLTCMSAGPDTIRQLHLMRVPGQDNAD